MWGALLAVLALVVQGDQLASSAILTVRNTAANQVTFMDASCKLGTSPTLEAGKNLSLNLSVGAHKFWVVPDGCVAPLCYPCGLDCLGCFYIAPIINEQGVMITSIGYGENSPVKVHDGVASSKFSAVDETGKKVEIKCNTTACDSRTNVVQAHSNMVFTVDGSSVVGTSEAQATLTVKNTAANQVTFMDASCQPDSAPALDAGKELVMNLTEGAHKFWVVPKGCVAPLCYPCGLDCLGCFYIAPIVNAQGVMVTSIGYGENAVVKVHDGVSGAKFSAVDQSGKEVDINCNTSSCDIKKNIVQAHSNMVLTIEGQTDVIV